MMSVKMATLGLLKIMVFCNKCYDVIVHVDYITNKILSRDSNYIIDLLIRTKFDNSSISIREAIKTSILYGFGRKTDFFEGWSWFKFNNLVQALVTNLKFYKKSQKV